VALELSADDTAALEDRAGQAAGMAMRLLVEVGQVAEAPHLIDVTSAHIDGCLYHGRAGLDWAERLVEAGARVAVPTTLNVSSLDLLHPHVYRGDPQTAAAARRLMDCYVAMGCRPTWTCAPYQLPERPSLGQQIAWAESNAIVFANSVLGARTERYGDFIDICAAITGRVPLTGLHTTEGRRGEVLFSLRGIPQALLDEDVIYAVLGHLVGRRAGTQVPVVDGLPPATSEDRLKALGAAAASSGAVALFHAVGITPEAATVEDALGRRAPARVVEVTTADIRAARDSLSTSAGEGLDAVSLGTPHFSVNEFAELVGLLDGARIHPSIAFYVSTGRDVEAEVARRGWSDVLERAGVQVVTDTCTYITPIIREGTDVVMTNSAKWAYYAPSNLRVEVLFGSMEECVRSAVSGRVWRDDGLWRGV
jgi:predicted aconitase